jgi:heat shock protein HtpX
MENNLKTAMLMALLGAILVGLGWLFAGQQGAIIALGIALAINFGMYWFSDRLAIAAARAKPVAEHELPNVYSIVRSLTMRTGMPMPQIYLIDSPQPNAFATGRNPKHAAVAVTTGILEALNYQELEGVLAHELSHVRNRDILIASVAATMAVALSFLARMAFWGGMGGRSRDNGAIGAILGLVAIIIAPLVALVIRLAISRSREYEADRSGAEITGAPLNLASALDKLQTGTTRHPMEVGAAASTLFIADPYASLSEQQRRDFRFGNLFSTHPPIPERIERLSRMASPLG